MVLCRRSCNIYIYAPCCVYLCVSVCVCVCVCMCVSVCVYLCLFNISLLYLFLLCIFFISYHTIPSPQAFLTENDPAKIDAFLTQHPHDLECYDERGDTRLILAARAGQTDIVKLLVRLVVFLYIFMKINIYIYMIYDIYIMCTTHKI